MRFGIFYEHQLPRPWAPGAEHQLLTDALEQVELADRVGFDYVWEVEHHFLEEYSHSSAPEVFLAAASQRTKRIRLGHGIVQAPPAVNHPARIAERVATLDLVSDGRVEFGTGESSSAAELGGFGVPREAKRAMWEETLDAVTRMFTEEPFAGYDGEFLRMPPRNVVPKPLQQPHPPLWVACSRRETIHLAARSGIGALSFSFVEPEDAAHWVTEYYDLIASEECVPRGLAVNPNVAVVLPMMLHPDEATAIDRGIDGAHFFGYALGHYYGGSSAPGRRDRSLAELPGQPRGAGLRPGDRLGHRRAAGRPPAGGGARFAARRDRDARRRSSELMARYEAAGVDQVMFVLQAGRNRHEHICESIELFAREVLPRFAEGRDAAEAAKADRLAAAVDKALARRAGPRYPAGALSDRRGRRARGRAAGPARAAAHAGRPGPALGRRVRPAASAGARAPDGQPRVRSQDRAGTRQRQPRSAPCSR